MWDLAAFIYTMLISQNKIKDDLGDPQNSAVNFTQALQQWVRSQKSPFSLVKPGLKIVSKSIFKF